MIALESTRAGMLEQLGASAALLARAASTTPADELVAAPEARVRVRGHAPAELLPQLDAFLARRFADVARERLERDLLSPLKKAVGNAHKRGNQRDPAKWITVELVLTPAGALVEVSDEGAGFDVGAVLARFRAGAEYFQHSGSGFRRYAKARSQIGFDRNGSTLRICFRP